MFKLTKSGNSWRESVIHAFEGTDGDEPSGALIFDSHGNLYGTTSVGGPNGEGTVFELTPSAGGQWSETIVYSFTGASDGGGPLGSLVMNNEGDFFCVAAEGGTFGGGVVFEIIP